MEASGERNFESIFKAFCLWFSGLKRIFRAGALGLTVTVIRAREKGNIGDDRVFEVSETRNSSTSESFNSVIKDDEGKKEIGRNWTL